MASFILTDEVLFYCESLSIEIVLTNCDRFISRYETDKHYKMTQSFQGDNGRFLWEDIYLWKLAKILHGVIITSAHLG